MRVTVSRQSTEVASTFALSTLVTRLRRVCGALESVASHALDFGFGILGYVAGAFDAVVAAAFVGAEINIAGEFADDFEIYAAGALGAERRNSDQRFADADGAEIDVEIEAAAQCQQAAFWALA